MSNFFEVNEDTFLEREEVMSELRAEDAERMAFELDADDRAGLEWDGGDGDVEDDIYN